METFYVAVHCTPNGPLYYQSASQLDARQHLAARIQVGFCRADDAMAIVEYPLNQAIYMRLKHNTVTGLLGSSEAYSQGLRVYFTKWVKTLATSWPSWRLSQ